MKTTVFVVLSLLLAGVIGAAIWLWTPDRSRAVLEAKYLKRPGDMMRVAGINLRVVDRGPRDGPALIMLHGFGSSLETWDAWAQILEGTNRVVRFDLPGSGLSEPDPSGDYTDARTLVVINALMDQLGIARASLIGNSIGGRIAWTLAAKYPDRVTKLVLISPDGFASPGFAYGKRADVPAIMQLMRYFLPKSMLRDNLVPAYGDPSKITDAVLTRYHDLMLAPGSRDALLARLRQTVLVDPVPLLAKIKVPVLLMWGEKDAMIPASNAADYQAVLPNATLALLPGLGHTPFEEDPATSIIPLKAFLAK